MKAALPGTDYFVGFIQQYVTPQLFRTPGLKLIQLLSAGYDRADSRRGAQEQGAAVQQRQPTRSPFPSTPCC